MSAFAIIDFILTLFLSAMLERNRRPPMVKNILHDSTSQSADPECRVENRQSPPLAIRRCDGSIAMFERDAGPNS